jgi:hypothetical protein
VAHVDGADSSDSASLLKQNSISVDPTIVGGPSEDVASNSSLFARWTLVYSTTWSQAQASGADLLSIPVTPFFGRTHPSGSAVLPVAGYVGSPFDYWRGDMEYLVIIPASKFHRGTLQFYWLPATATTPAEITNTTLNAIIDVSTGGEHEFIVGYARDAPYLAKSFVTEDVTIVQTGFGNGFLRARVINPLISQATTASVQVLIFARAGANMDFQQPSVSIVYPDPVTGYVVSDITKGLVVQQGALGDQEEHGHEEHILVPSSGHYPGDQILWGENVSSVRALMQKPCRWMWTGASAPSGRIVMPQLGPIPGLVSVDAPLYGSNFTYAGWYRTLFLGVSASERFKFLPRGDCMIGAAPITKRFGSDDFSNFASLIAPMTFCGPNRGAEIVIPYYNHQKFLLGRRLYDDHYVSTGSDGARMNAVYLEATGSEALEEVAVYHGLGPDIRLSMFRQCPVVTFPKVAAGPKVFWQFV